MRCSVFGCGRLPISEQNFRLHREGLVKFGFRGESVHACFKILDMAPLKYVMSLSLIATKSFASIIVWSVVAQ